MMKNTHSESNNAQAKKLARPALIGLTLLLLGYGLMPSALASPSFNNVQIFVNTATQLQYSYTFTAYNLTGSLLGTYQGNFPAGAFELPSGDYLFTVSAIYQNYNPCYQCAYATSGAPAASASNSAYPVKYYQPASEYGFVQAHIGSSQSLTIDTKNVTQFPTTAVTIKVSYVNGTAAEGASVSASVVGQWYYWWGQSTDVMMWAQTDSSGIAKLILPTAPAVISAWKWVQVDIPASQTTVTRNVGGEAVNVTVYWQPSYVGLAASTLLLPPASSATLTLHYQQSNYWVMPMGAKSSQGVASQPIGIPTQVNMTAGSQSPQYYVPNQIPSSVVQSNPQQVTGAQAPALSGLTLTGLAGSAVVLAALAIAVVVVRSRRPREATV
jgi:hypothetical protein